MQLACYAYRTLIGIMETSTSYCFPEFEIKENKVGFRGYRFSTKGEQGEK